MKTKVEILIASTADQLEGKVNNFLEEIEDDDNIVVVDIQYQVNTKGQVSRLEELFTLNVQYSALIRYETYRSDDYDY